MNNTEIAGSLNEIAQLLELKGESSFRIRAYQNAAKTIGALTVDVSTLTSEGELEDIPGVGEGIARKIEELVGTHHIQYLDQLREEFPPGVRRLLAVPGVGPTLARRAYRELGVENLDQLREVAENGTLAALKGLGQRSAENVLRGLQRVSKDESRMSIGDALPLAEDLMDHLRGRPYISNLTPAGSLRRRAPTIGDIDLMATSDEPERVMEDFIGLPHVANVLGHGPTKSAIVTHNGLQVDLRIVEAASFGSLLQHFTGSKDHNIQLREYALHRGLSLNEYAITTVKSGDAQRFADEMAFYAALDLEWIPPELRHGQGEIEAAAAHSLPRLVTVDDIRGDLHAHSDWSDGSGTIQDMVLAAKARGYEYVAITDHSPSVGVAGGLDVEQLLRHTAEVRRLDAEIDGIAVLAGTEVDIKRDGSIDYPDEVLGRLDWVVASVHSGFNQSRDQMTYRILAAIENPNVDAIGHPTGILVGQRAPYDVDLEAVFKAAARHHTALEINAQPSRLDLVDFHARRARELGVMLVVNTDAHASVQFDLLRYGIEVARRSWAEPRNILNTRRLGELRAWVNRDEQ